MVHSGAKLEPDTGQYWNMEVVLYGDHSWAAGEQECKPA